MSNPSQPYKLSSGRSVGDAAAKAGAQIGTAISEGVQAVAGVKKHRNALQHIAEQNQLGHERMIHAMSHADSLAAQAKERGQDMTVKADHSSVEYSSRSVKGPKGTKPPKSPKSPKSPANSTQLALAPGNPPRSALPQGKGPSTPSSGSSGSAPSKPEPKPADVTVKPMLALPAGKSSTLKESNSRTMKDFNANKKSRGITGGPKAPKSGVAGKKIPTTMPKIIESLDQSRETTNKNVDKAWAYLANKRKQEKKKGN
jgi:hypothetical protein